VVSVPRMRRYVDAVQGDTRKAMTLYRLNLKLSQQLFTIVSCFEIALRNAIDKHYTLRNGPDWLRDAALPGGMYSLPNCGKTPQIIREALHGLTSYSHPKLLAELPFGFWRYAFARHQFFAGGQSLLSIFPAKPRSTPILQYNHGYVFSELGKINNLRNRLAHHEPICFATGQPVINTDYAKQHYLQILNLFRWMGIDEGSLLYGVDHINNTLDAIAALQI